MRLYTVETMRYQFITSVTAKDRQQAERKAWRKIAKLRPDLVPMLREKGILVMLENTGGLWGVADLG